MAWPLCDALAFLHHIAKCSIHSVSGHCLAPMRKVNKNCGKITFRGATKWRWRPPKNRERPEKSRLSLLAFILKGKWSHIAYTQPCTEAQCVHCQNVRNAHAHSIFFLNLCACFLRLESVIFALCCCVFGQTAAALGQILGLT